MKGMLKALAYVELILGVIGSFFTAKAFGMSFVKMSYERNWPMTIGIFVGSLFCFVILFVIMVAIEEILHNQDTIYKKITEGNADTKAFINSDPTSFDGWKCSKCGKNNANYVGTCSCGNTK